jgi:hypothetical protein
LENVKCRQNKFQMMDCQNASWSETPIFEAVRNYNCQVESFIKTIGSNQADINVKCKTLSQGIFLERSALHLALDEFLGPEVLDVLIKYGADPRSVMTQVKNGSISNFDCSQRLESIRAMCNDASSGETEKLAHLDWCGRTFTQEWCVMVLRT